MWKALVIVLSTLSALFALGAPKVQNAPVVAGFTNDFAVLELDSAGKLSCLADRATGRNLLRYHSSPTLLRLKGGKSVEPERLLFRDGVLVFTWAGRSGDVAMSVRTEAWGFVFKIERAGAAAADDVEALLPVHLWPAQDLCRWVGGCACSFSDSTNTVALRAYDLETAMSTPGKVILETSIAREFSAVGQRMALVAAPYAKARDCLKALTLDAGVFHTKCGGAWSLDAPENRRSYLFSGASYDTIDDWIALAERGGFGTMHFSGWWKTKGHYDPSPTRFPGGKEQLKACIDKVRAAGLAVSTHTLCSGIDFSDPWITPVCRTNLLALYTYTLAAPLAPDAKELVVEEPPGPRHDTVTTYFSNGNILRVGGELMTYSAVRRERPYAFTGLKRGAFGTSKTGLVGVGAKVDYVFQHFFTLFPDPRSDFDDEMARHLGDVIDYYGFSLVYHDGAEPFPRYDADLNRLKFSRAASRTRDNIQFEASMSNPHGWWFHSTSGALDVPTWAAKRYHAVHVKSAVDSRIANFWNVQTGWWSPRRFSDEMEYFASKNAANDLSMSAQDVGFAGGHLSFHNEDQMTLLGWYERPRLARAFTPEAIEVMRREGGEARLRQNESGAWEVFPVECRVHRVASSGFRGWTQRASDASRAGIRVEALYGAAPYDSPEGRDLIGAGDVKSMKFATAGADVVQDVSETSDPVRGRTLRIAAENRRKTRRGAWTRLSLDYPDTYRDVSVKGRPGGAFGFWVKGDGSGAILNLQLQTPAKFVGGISDHVVKLDFKGWRYVQLFPRERDVEAWLDYSWPYAGFYQIFRQRLDLKRIEHVSVYLNEVPACGRTVVELSQVRVLPSLELTQTDVAVSVNGKPFALPFPLVSGEYAELEDGFWTRYSESGAPIARGSADSPSLVSGENVLAFTAKSADGDPRAEVTVFALGGGVPAFADGALDSGQMEYEAMRPQWFSPTNGFDSVEPVRVRPGKTARLDVELIGSAHDPALVYPDGEIFPFGTDLDGGFRLVCHGGVSWKMLDGKRNIVKEGRLPRPLPALSGGAARFTASKDSSVRVSVVKRYSKTKSAVERSRSATVAKTAVAVDADAAKAARETLRAWLFDEGEGAFAREAGRRDWDVALSPSMRWATGQFGTALAFMDAKASAYVPGTSCGGCAWTATAWTHASNDNKASAPWDLKGDRSVGRPVGGRWKLVAVEGHGPVPSFRLGTDGREPFAGFVDDLRIYPRHLTAEELERLSANPMYIDIDGWQDDGTGGVKPTTVSPPCAVEAAGKAALPGEGSRKKPIPPDPFPDGLSAYVWRNWGLVPTPILASVVGAEPEALESIAGEMGLPKTPDIPPQWRRKGYITIVRRNWHLLPYSQLLPLLGMTREEFYFALMEDDFLWVKLGRVKPECERMVWTPEAAERGRAARRRLAAVLAEEGLDPAADEEPRFSFMRELAATDGSASPPETPPGESPFDFRLIFSYFADYADPLADPDVGSFPEGLLQKLAAEGVNAVWMQTVLNTLVRDARYSEFGEGSEMRLENLRKLVARAAKYGIKVYLYMNEPRAMPAEFFAADPSRAEIKGTWDPALPARFTMCTSTSEVRRWLRDSLEKVFREVPGLGGIFTITMSENLTNCASHGGKARCPRCKDRPVAEILAEVNGAMIEGMARGNPSAEALVWNWNWPQDKEEAVVARLPRSNCRLMAVSEYKMAIERGGVKVRELDYAISIVGPGENAKRLWGYGRKHGIPGVAKVQAANSWELSPFPYIPTMDLVAEHAANLVAEGVKGVMLSWSLGCCPSPNLSVYRDIRPGPAAKDEVLDVLARRLYGARAPEARRAWKAFSDGFRNYPFTVWTIYMGPQQWGPANPLYPRRTGYNATMVGIPYDDLENWRSAYPAQTYVDLMGRVADGFEEGCRLMDGVAGRRELDMFRAEQMHFAACRDQALFVMARDAGDAGAMRAAAARELKRAKEYWPIVRADSRIGYESSNHYFFTPRDVLEKILSCRAVLDAAVKR